jgi:dTDP-4-dehydrorhamnose reductase
MRVLVTGASGQLGGYLLRRLQGSDLTVIAWSGSRRGELFGSLLHPVDLEDADAVRAAFHHARPDIILHAAALARIADCHRNPDRARRINTDCSALLAELAAAAKTRLLLVSTDLVFDGERGGYREADAPSPLSIYGRSKADAEAAVLAVPRSVVLRVSLLYGPSVVGRPSFFDEQVAALRAGRSVTLFADEWRTPLALSTAAEALVALARSDFTGLLHIGGPERLSRLEMGQRLADFLNVPSSTVVAMDRADIPAPEPRPRDTSLDSSRWRALFPELPWPAWREGLEALLHP